MHFSLVDAILERSSDRIVTLKNVTTSEEYLQDHFPSFPVLPGVMMIEALVQAARILLESDAACGERWVLCGVRALKFGNFVRPGEALRAEVEIVKRLEDGWVECRGVGTAVRQSQSESEPATTCVSGKLIMRPLRPPLAAPTRVATRHAGRFELA